MKNSSEFKQSAKSTFDEQEVEKFVKIADEWWDESGKFKPLHQFNPIRLHFISLQIRKFFNENHDEKSIKFWQNREFKTGNKESKSPQSLQPFTGLNILDIGCGGGLVCEPMATLGADVVGIDAAAQNIEVAKIHAAKSGLKIDYRRNLAEELVDELNLSKEITKSKNEQNHFSKIYVENSSLNSQETLNSLPKNGFEVVLALEVIEHVANPNEFLRACSDLLAPNGLLFIATLNRSIKSLLTAKIAAEYLLKWLPAGTHDWNKFLKPSEVENFASESGLKLKLLRGFSYCLFRRSWQESEDLSVNYCAVFSKNPSEK